MSTVTIKPDECKENNWQINLLKNKFGYKDDELNLSQNEKMKKEGSLNQHGDYSQEQVDKEIDQILGRKSRIDYNQKLKNDLLNCLTAPSDQSKITFKSLNTGQSVTATNNHSRFCLIQ
jgi:hypothetical protein